ncbi:MAG: hypothetical protein PHD81_02660 [Candidatus Nanoarchaeia archaeon]|nr:hypothetical protein [Candidatus Nanoarchaeia archaeon]MDD5587987.1 hypothetical protein [Candidatus Nanoarchaeia archaeon]
MKYKIRRERIGFEGQQRDYEAIYPEKHSRIKGIILNYWDDNKDDSYANRKDYHSVCEVLYKGDIFWKKVFDGRGLYFKIDNVEINANDSIDEILLKLEDEKTREKLVKKDRISELKVLIKKSKRELKSLEHSL